MDSVRLEAQIVRADRWAHVLCVWMELLLQAGGSVWEQSDSGERLVRAVAARGVHDLAVLPHALQAPLCAVEHATPLFLALLLRVRAGLALGLHLLAPKTTCAVAVGVFAIYLAVNMVVPEALAGFAIQLPTKVAVVQTDGAMTEEAALVGREGRGGSGCGRLVRLTSSSQLL